MSDPLDGALNGINKANEPESLFDLVGNIKSFGDVVEVVVTIFGRAMWTLFLEAFSAVGHGVIALVLPLLLPLLLLKSAYDDFRVSRAEQKLKNVNTERELKIDLQRHQSSVPQRTKIRFKQVLSLFKGVSTSLITTVYKFMIRAAILPPQILVALISYAGFVVINTLYYIVYGKYPEIETMVKPLKNGPEKKQSVLLYKYAAAEITNISQKIVKALGAELIQDVDAVIKDIEQRANQQVFVR